MRRVSQLLVFASFFFNIFFMLGCQSEETPPAEEEREVVTVVWKCSGHEAFGCFEGRKYHLVIRVSKGNQVLKFMAGVGRADGSEFRQQNDVLDTYNVVYDYGTAGYDGEVAYKGGQAELKARSLHTFDWGLGCDPAKVGSTQPDSASLPLLFRDGIFMLF